MGNYDTAQVIASRVDRAATAENGGEVGLAAEDPYQIIGLHMGGSPSRKMTYIGIDTKSKDIVPERPVFETLDEVKKISNHSALMRPTLNSQGSFVNRSICGSPNGLE